MKLPKPGDQVHFLVTGLTIPTSTGIMALSHVTTRGETITITDDLIQAARDRHGAPGWPALVHDEAAQFARWGEVRFRPGPAPDDLESWTPGTPEADEAREQARRAAYAIVDDGERRKALRDIDQKFGRLQTSRTINSAPARALVTRGETRGR
ncbi:MAG: hypothetical protein KIT89_11100 [Microcella sp.]|uniref:hypothetical protein n=1 Tax=Microcella sp. TaxID=1913979 RepID=UPI0024C7A3B6|nr:hypothetical protein [Microcella sp.]UYN83234.1 MAG: hypothetical protein KIT89_11100 [Microcella sp.]